MKFMDYMPEFYKRKIGIFQKCIKNTQVLKEIANISEHGTLTDAEMEGSIDIEFVKELSEGSSASAMSEVTDFEQIEIEKVNYMVALYVKAIKFTKSEWEALKAVKTEIDAEGFWRATVSRFSAVISALLKKVNNDTQTQNTKTSVRIESIEDIATQGVYKGIDGAKHPWWQPHFREVTLTVDELKKLDSQDSVHSNTMNEIESFLEEVAEDGTPKLCICGSNVYELVRLALKNKGIFNNANGTYNEKNYENMKFIKANSPEWKNKRNMMIVVSEESVIILDNGENITPNGDDDIKKIDNTPRGYKAMSVYGIVMGAKNRRSLGKILFSSVPNKTAI